MPYLAELSEAFNSMTGDANSVAVIGLSCRFAGDAATADKFWELLCNAKSAWSEPDRFNINGFHTADKGRLNTITPIGAHFMQQDIAAFDTNFFNISPSEAMAMDPQQRIMLEVAYEAFENAGLSLQAVAGTNTSCYVGNFMTDYREMLLKDSESAPRYSLSGSGSEMIAARLSWFFDLKGPSFTLGTACSSSLVALHQGCHGLRTGESNMAIVGGTNLLLNPEEFSILSNQQFLAQDGRCKSFDERGDGYGRGEGFAALVLKRIDDAIRDGDPIRAVIRGTGSNHDGKTKGITVPNAKAQADLIRSTYRLAGIDFRHTLYFEAHGTGTKVGDPSELEAISKTLGSVRQPGNPIMVGSVKPNIGHTEATAGLAGVIKAIYILEQAMIPPNILFEKANPRILFNEWGIRVPTRLTRWPTEGLRRVSVNSFGYGGTNAHAILDDAFHYLNERRLQGIHFTKTSTPSDLRNTDHRDLHVSVRQDAFPLQSSKFQKKLRLFVLSAQDKDGLKRQREFLCKYLKERSSSEISDEYLRDLAFTLSERRSQLLFKTYSPASTVDELISCLQEEEFDMPSSRLSSEPAVGFIFTGQGAQWAKMGIDLERYSVFRDSVEGSDEFLRSVLGCRWSAREEIRREGPQSNINLPVYSQPICTVLQIALVDLLESWNIVPNAIVGHSSGEIAGAYCLGALTKEDALKAAYYRGLLSSQMKSLSPMLNGSMLAAGLSESEAQNRISQVSRGIVVVACVNSPSSVTISGDVVGIDELQVMLTKENIFTRKLKVETAYHSPHMDAISVPYLEAIKDIQTRESRQSRKMYSAVTGSLVDPDELGPMYWIRNLVSPVLFYDALHELLRPTEYGQRAAENAVDILLELGPHSALQGPATQTMKEHGINNVDYRTVLKRERNGVETVLSTAGALFAQGIHVDISRVNNDTSSEPFRPLVSIPSYCWNHSRTFWAESRISKQYRFRKQPRLRLLGAPCPTLSETESLWRGFQRTSEEPWIRDHKIQTSILYPGASYIAMAIEGACQIAAKDRVIDAFHLRDIQFIAPAVITEEVDLECILQLRPHLTGTRDNSSTWLEFIVSTSSEGQDLRQNCYGLLIIEYKTTEETGTSVERQFEEENIRNSYWRAEKLCRTSEDPKDFYQDLSAIGLNYGPTFQNISRIRRCHGQSCCDVDISNPDLEEVPGQSGRPYIVHPTTLDAMFHAVFAAYKGQRENLRQTMVPKSIEEVTISAELPFQVGTRFKGFSNASKHGFRELMADLVMLDESVSKPAVVVKGFCCSAIAGSSETIGEEIQSQGRNLFSKTVWEPAIQMLSSDQKRELLDTKALRVTLESEPTRRVEKLEMLAFFYIRRVLEQVSMSMVTTLHLQEFYRWMQKQLTSWNARANVSQGSEYWCSMDERMAVEIQREIEAGGETNGEALCHIGQELKRIILGDINAEQSLQEKGLLDRVFRDLEGRQECFHTLKEYIKVLAHNNPDISILELGGGTGGAASSILSATNDLDGTPRAFDYVFSTPTADSLKKAEELLHPWKGHVQFQTLVIEKDTDSQGFESRRFDFIIISEPFIAVQSPDKAIANAKKLLKPGGKLCFLKFTKLPLRLSLVLACIPSYCSRMTSGQQLSLTDDEMLKILLRRNDFSLDLIPTRRDTELNLLVVTTAAAPSEKQSSGHEITILEASNSSRVSQELATRIAAELEINSITTRRVTWNNTMSFSKANSVISLMDLTSPCMLDLAEEDFLAMKQLVLNSNLLWVSIYDDPAGHITSGMARSIRNEIPGKQFRTLLVQSLDSIERLALLIGKLAMTSTTDDEFLEENGVLKICRVLEDLILDEQMARYGADRKNKIEVVPLENADGPLRLAIRSQGMLDTLCLEMDDEAPSHIGNDEIEIEVKATGLNFRDVMVTMGQIPDNLLGFEAAGIVKRVGRDVKQFTTGDHACTLGHGCHKTLFRNKASFSQPIPAGLSFADAATLPLVHCTAFYALVHIARVRQGQTILIHAAAGGVGQAAIQMAKHFKLEIFATVGTPDKKQLIQELYDIAEDHIYNSRDLSFAKGVLRMTNGRGVDCVLNSLSGEALRQSWHCIAPFGSFVEIGMRDILSNTRLEMRPFMQDASFTFFNLKHVMTANPKLLADIMHNTFEFLRRGVTKPVSPVTVYPISKVENAFRLMQTGKHRGKIAITWEGDDSVPVLPRQGNELKLDGEASYLLIGGLGGLGRSLSNLLVDLGARNIWFLSRSGGKSDEAQKHIQNLEKIGVQIRIIRCDVADKNQLAGIIVQSHQGLPRIKGVFQCAAVLRDTLFEKMTYQQWTESMRPKVQGTWNLHSLLPHDLDFFITLSSFAGVFGNRTQSNYAAAGAFQDGLAHYRRSRGLKAVTVDLGVMRDVGMIAEHGALDYIKEWEGPFGIREHEFHMLIKGIIASELNPDANLGPQILTGFATGTMARAAGVRRPFYFDDPRFSHLAKIRETTAQQQQQEALVSGGQNRTTTVPLKEQLMRAETLADAAVAMKEALLARVARSTQMNVSDIDEQRSLYSYGVDSLVAVEIGNWVFKESKVAVSGLDLLSNVSIASLAQKLSAKSPFLPAGLMEDR